jgi:hypothetical protein
VQWSFIALVTLPLLVVPFAGWFALVRAVPSLGASRLAFCLVEMVLVVPVILGRFVFEAHSISTLNVREILDGYYLRAWASLAIGLIVSCLALPSVRLGVLGQRK